MRIAIIGAGIGGLCVAVGLQRAGAEVVVLERAAEVRAGGSGLSVFANGIRALDALGVGQAFRDVTARTEGFRAGQRNPRGTWLSTLPADAVEELRIVDRADLHRLLSGALAAGTVLTGRQVVSAYANGLVESVGVDPGDADRRWDLFDLVIGADGLRSAVRAGWSDDPGVARAGYGAWRGITTGPFDLYGEAGETWGIGARFGVAPLADGRAYWFAVRTERPDSRGVTPDPAPGAQPVRELVGQWHQPIPELIDATDPTQIHYLPIEELAGDLPTFVRGRVILLGDAAHAMTPNLGQGGGTAMEDAATLAGLLAPIATAAAADLSVSLPEALRRYDRLRRPRTQQLAARARAIGKLAHRPGPLLSPVRDLVLRATPAAVLRRQIAGVQGWRPTAPVPRATVPARSAVS